VWDVALVGAGNLGKAIADYPGFVGRGFMITAIFDVDPAKIGRPMGIHNVIVQHVDELAATIQARGIKIGIIATPAEHAQGVARTMAEAGIRAILNYAPITIAVPAGVYIQHIDPVVGLQRMTYYL